MSMRVESNRKELIQTSLWGVGRGLAVRIMIYPLDVVRTYQQSKHLGNSFQVFADLYREGGLSIFFSGLSPQLVRTSLKQAWVWPMFTYAPSFIPVSHPLGQQAITGLMIAVVDATITTPLEKAKIGLMISGKKGFSLSTLWKDGWNGYVTHLAKLSVSWSTFLVGQKFFRDRNTVPGKRASVAQLCDIALKTTLLVSVISAPLDMANTQKFANQVNFSTFIANHKFRTLFRGSPLNFASLLIQNLASIALIDQLDRR